MATVILARHGRTSSNASGVLAGRSKGVHLDETGIKQAEDAAERLAGLPLAALVSSPLERCRETAAAIRRRQPAPISIASERRLLECDYGSWTGRELKELAKEPLWRTVQGHPSAAIFPEGESMAQMLSRSVAAVRDWDARVETDHGSDAVWLAVSHGDVIKAILGDALGMHLDLFQRIVVDPGSLSVIRFTPMRPFVVSVNSVAGDLGGLRPPKRRSRRRKATKVDSDAAVGGGPGALPGRRGGARGSRG
jgi:2,3-bisphosphoglycerate-dependent phosphoglycerate mutase